jgi:uncharacterized Fe-S cluster-containing MiaB family protein
VTIAIHTPDSEEADKKQDQLEEEMVRDFNSGSNGDESQLKDMDVENLRLKVREVYHEVRSLYSESRMGQIRQDGLNKLVQDNNSSNFYSALIESFVFVAIGAAQVWYIKNLLDSKRVI